MNLLFLGQDFLLNLGAAVVVDVHQLLFVLFVLGVEVVIKCLSLHYRLEVEGEVSRADAQPNQLNVFENVTK